MRKKSLRIGAASLNQTPLDWKGNLGNIELAVERARQEKVRVLCLPELCITGYSCQDMFFSPWVAETAWKQLQKLTPLAHEIYFSVGLPVWFEGKVYNCVAFLGEGRILGITAKQKLPADGIYYEPRWFEPWPGSETRWYESGGQKLEIGEMRYEVDGYRIGFEVCEDAWRKDRPGISLHEKGVDIVLNPSASHFEFDKTGFREKLMKDSSSRFQCTYIYANQLGNEAGRMIYEGDLIIAHRGDILQRGPILTLNPTDLVTYDLQPGVNPVPLKESAGFSREEQFLKAATLALFDYLRKSHSRCFIISLSGGADSACCAVLVKKMIDRGLAELGREEFASRLGRPDLLEVDDEQWPSELLYCVYQSTVNSSSTTLKAARGLAEELGATFFNWSIQDELDSGLKKVQQAMGRSLTWERDDIALQNVQARMRAPLVWVLANVYSGLLLTTSNRSEGDVGYTTMDGDTSGSLAPLAGIDKPFIRSWLRWAETHLDLPSLRRVNDQQPTAELRPEGAGQTDEDDLMPYSLLLIIERSLIKERLSPEQTVKKLVENKVEEERARNYVNRFALLWSRNQWKRERLAPSFHFDDFNIDPKTWMRFPILNGGLGDDIED